MFKHLIRTTYLSLAVFGLSFQLLYAQDFPKKPVRLLVGVPPGGSVDVMARALGAKLSELWKQSVVVENLAGASEIIAAEHVARSAPDGYTLFVATEVPIEVNPLLFSKLPYDPKKDFAPVTRLLEGPMLFAVVNELPVNNMAEFIAYAKANPGKVSYGSSGLGGQVHLAMAYLAKSTGTELIHVPYKGAAPAVQDMLSGSVQSTAVPVSLIGPHIQAGKVRAIGIAGTKRVKFLPNVSTLTEQGFASLDASWALSVVAPAGTPIEIRRKIATDIRRILKDPQFEENQLERYGYTPVGDTPEQFAAYLLKNQPIQAARVLAANVKLD
jgi:tripartite-type tricarboxylate transporter receptor subunit TctC